mmetsp:Transcript_72924/g.213666  ORF Transcript_72924/g.213666 Transcript_72924/m.213666 type:complete len:380 (+) Transcript_72924:488-1627(+)
MPGDTDRHRQLDQDNLVLGLRCVLQAGHLRISPWWSQVLGEREAGPEIGPVEDGVVALEHRLPQDEHVRADGLGPAHRQQLGRAEQLARARAVVRHRAERLLLLRVVLQDGARRHGDVGISQDVGRHGQQAHVVLGVEREVEAVQLQHHGGCVHAAAVLELAGGLRQQVVKGAAGVTGDAEVRGAAVEDAVAVALVADVHLGAVDVHREDPDLPVAELRLCHGHPRDGLQQVLGVVAADGYLAGLPIVALRQEEAEVRPRKLPAPHEEIEGTEVVAQRQCRQAKAYDAIKVELLERSRRHLCGHDRLREHAWPLLRTRRCLGPQAQPVAHKVARDPGGAEADGHALAHAASGHGPAVQVDLLACLRCVDVVALVLHASG